jgi:hypothetical protein
VSLSDRYYLDHIDTAEDLLSKMIGKFLDADNNFACIII